MADEDIPDLDHDALDWFYVEDDFPLADELAESQIPDPGYAGTKYELDMADNYDFDLFDYWDDLHYGDDCYWDRGAGGATALKRKRDTVGAHKTTDKRRKLSLKDTSGGNVVFVNRAIRNKLSRRVVPHNGRSYALFPDWRERFAGEDGQTAQKEMPADMKMAAEGEADITPEKRLSSRVASASTGEEDVYDEDGVEGDDLHAELASLDPEMLQTILRQRMGDAGLEGMDENAFMSAINKMLSGEGGESDIAGTLADDLLNQATEGNDTALAGWLSQQGVSLQDAEEEEEAADMAPPIPGPLNAVSRGQHLQSSPSDSVIDSSVIANGTSNAELAIHTSSPKGVKKKRAASPTQDGERDEPKAKKIALDSAEASEPKPSPPYENIEPVSHHLDSNPETIAAETKAKEANAKAVAANQKTTGTSAASEKNSVPDATEPNGDVAPTTKSKSPRQTRKRKAGAQDDDTTEPRAAKKQAKKGPATTGPAQAAGRRTRSTRSTTKTSS